MIDSRLAMGVAASLVATAVMGILAFMAWALIFETVPTDNREPLLMLIGVLANLATFVVGYFFGSSQGARLKDSTIERQAGTIQAAQAALAPLDTHTVPVAPGEAVTVKGTEE